MSAQDCPSESEILDLAEGRLAEKPRALLLAHLDRCEECRQIVAALAPDEHPAPGAANDKGSGERAVARAVADRPELRSALGELREGRVVAGRYRIERLLGAGGMGAVFAAHHIGIDKRVALKIVKRDLSLDDEAVSRLLREAKAAAALGGEHVVAVIDAGRLEETGDPFVVYEYLEGEDLAHVLAKRGRLPIAFAVDLILGACEALAVAHARDIVHRDIKPANLFLTERADGSALLKVLDFGIAKVGWSDGTETSRRAILGSPRYMAPEQLRSSTSVDARADVWSLGVTLFELVTGEPPFQGDSVIEICAAIATEPPRDLAALLTAKPDATDSTALVTGLTRVIASCLEKNVAARCSDVAALAQSLEPFASEEGRASAKRVIRIQERARSLPPSAGSVPPTGASSTPSGQPFSQPRPAVDPATASTLSATFGASASPHRPGGLARWAVLGVGALAALAIVVFVTFGTRPRAASVNEPTVGTMNAPAKSGATSTPTATATPTATSTATSTATTTSTATPTSISTPENPKSTSSKSIGAKTESSANAGPTAPNPFRRDGLSDRH